MSIPLPAPANPALKAIDVATAKASTSVTDWATKLKSPPDVTSESSIDAVTVRSIRLSATEAPTETPISAIDMAPEPTSE